MGGNVLGKDKCVVEWADRVQLLGKEKKRGGIFAEQFSGR